MGQIITITNHPKYLNRLADIYLQKQTEDGPVAAEEYVDRFFTHELIGVLGPVIHKKLTGK